MLVSSGTVSESSRLSEKGVVGLWSLVVGKTNKSTPQRPQRIKKTKWPPRNLLLHNRELMPPDACGIDAISGAERAVQSDIRILRLEVVIDEKLQRQARDVDVVDRRRLHVHLRLAVLRLRGGDDLHVVRAAEHAHQRIESASAAAFFDGVKIDAGIRRDYSIDADQSQGANALGQLGVGRSEPGIDLLLGEHCRRGVGLRPATVLVDV